MAKIIKYKIEKINLNELSRGEVFCFWGKSEKPSYVVIHINKNQFIFEATMESGFGMGERTLKVGNDYPTRFVYRFSKKKKNMDKQLGMF